MWLTLCPQVSCAHDMGLFTHSCSGTYRGPLCLKEISKWAPHSLSSLMENLPLGANQDWGTPLEPHSDMAVYLS